MSTWNHKIDRAGNTRPMFAYFESESGTGATGAHGQGTFAGLSVGIYDAQGNLTALDGTPYIGAAAVPGVNTLPPRMIVRVTRDGEDVLYGTFSPVETSAGVLDLNLALTAGLPVVGTPDPGQSGTAATITIGSVVTGAPGSAATVTNSGTSSAAIFDFSFPRGNPGAAGRGIASVGLSGDHLTGTYSDGTPWDAGALPGGGGGLTAVAHDNTLVGDGTAANPLSVKSTGASGTGAILSTVLGPRYGEASQSGNDFTNTGKSDAIEHRVRTTAALTMTGYVWNVRGQYTAERWRLRVYASTVAWGRGALLATVTADTDFAEYAAGVVEFALGTNLSVEAGAYLLIVLDVDPGSPQTFLGLERRYTGQPSTVEVASGPVMSSWVLRQSDGSSDNNYRFVGQVRGVDLVKTTINPLDPADFPRVDSVAAIPAGGGARLNGTNFLYVRRSNGQLLQFEGTPVNG